jgi:hypothetical protein
MILPVEHKVVNYLFVYGVCVWGAGGIFVGSSGTFRE